MSWGDIASGSGQEPSNVGGAGVGIAEGASGFLQGAQVGTSLMDRAAQQQQQRRQQSLEGANVYLKGLDLYRQNPGNGPAVQGLFDQYNQGEPNPDRHLKLDPAVTQNMDKTFEAMGHYMTAVTDPDPTHFNAFHAMVNPQFAPLLYSNKNMLDKYTEKAEKNYLYRLAATGSLAVKKEFAQNGGDHNAAVETVLRDPMYAPILADKQARETMQATRSTPEEVQQYQIQKAAGLLDMVSRGTMTPEHAEAEAGRIGPAAATWLGQQAAIASYKAGTTAGAVEKSKVMTGEEPSGQVDENGNPVSISGVGAKQAGAAALAKETPSEKLQREARAAASTGHLEVARGHLAVSQDREARMEAVQEKMGATIKTFEGEAIKIAATVFPVEKNPTQHYALLQYLQNNIRGLGALAASGKSPEEIMADFTQEIARIKGEIPQVAPTPQAQTGVKHFLSRFWDATLGQVIGKTQGDQPNAQPAPPAKPPLGKAARPAPTLARPKTAAEAAQPAAQPTQNQALLSARQSITRALFPGRPWEELEQGEQEQILGRMRGQPEEE